jgi:UDP-2,3-diacylglucosamine pyrophosphatase LpxH
MTSTSARLTEVLEAARREPIPFDDDSRFIIFSDCHRGDNGWADDFAHNQVLFFHALDHYFAEGFSYIELGDGDELWENQDFDEIRRQHDHIFWQMQRFYRADPCRLRLIWGNHDIVRKDPKTVETQLYHYWDDREMTYKPLFPGLRMREGLVLQHRYTHQEVFLTHGHQGSLLNDRFWRVGRFATRHFWRHAQLLGIPDPTRPAQNPKVRNAVEQQLSAWAQANRCVLICGHTHRSQFPDPGSAPYFNTGSCVHPRCITGIEIRGREIELIKWWIKPISGALQIEKESIVGPRPLGEYDTHTGPLQSVSTAESSPAWIP